MGAGTFCALPAPCARRGHSRLALRRAGPGTAFGLHNSLRLFATLDLTQLLEGADLVEAALRRDPRGRLSADGRAQPRSLPRAPASPWRKSAAWMSTSWPRNSSSARARAATWAPCSAGAPERPGLRFAQLLPALILSAGLAVYFRSLPLFFPALAALWELFQGRLRFCAVARAAASANTQAGAGGRRPG